MKKLLSVFILIVIPLSLNAMQEVRGLVEDLSTGEPIPFVNIGIIKLSSGTVSDESGNFRLNYKDESDRITFSAIGYEVRDITVRELKDEAVVRMSPVVYDLEEVGVEARGYDDPKNLGHVLRSRGQSIGFGTTMLGTEIGGLIRIDRETVINSAHFTVNHINKAPLLLRVNLYEFTEEKTGRNLLPENVIIEAPSEPGLINVDLTKYNLSTDQDVLLTLEWIKGVKVEGTQGITFRARNVRRRSNVWFRSASLAPFMNFENIVEMQIGFYLKVQQIRR
ncbi:carboxypeptidase-like regulatory domain-containing protein [Balneola sp. MJW-20]|uniref:carboxypeptidase-like regulatory domain-containing protein n=1 Tax=Gracilimonas aurantiaca TaxID=3234185 RepID=UPI0034679E1F